MFFECRVNRLAVAPAFAAADAQFWQGNAVDAAACLPGLQAVTSPHDALLWADVHRAVGDASGAAWAVRRASRMFPGDVSLQCLGALYGFKRPTGLMRPTASDTFNDSAHAALRVAFMALAAAKGGRRRDAVGYIDRAAGLGDFHPLVAHLLAQAHALLRDHSAASDLHRQVCTAAPRWVRARVRLMDSLYALGLEEEADAELQKALAAPEQDAGLITHAALAAFAQGAFAPAAEHCRVLLKSFPAAVRGVDAGLLGGLAARWSGDSDASQRFLAMPVPPTMQRRRARAQIQFDAPMGKPAWVKTPLVAQAQRDCLPTACALLANAAGRRLDVRELAIKMRTDHGTAMPRALDVMAALGLKALHVVASADAVAALLAQGVPLLLSVEGVEVGHVQVIVGHEPGADVFAVRDPMHWAPMLLSRQGMQSLLAECAYPLVAFVAGDNGGASATSWLDPCGPHLNRLEQAIHEANTPAAVEAYEALKKCAGPGVALLADMMGSGTTVRPSEVLARVAAALVNTEIPLMARLRAAGHCDVEGLSAAAKTIHGEPALVQMVTAQLNTLRAVETADWETLIAITKDPGGSERQWCLRATAFLELGDAALARHCLDAAAQIAPASPQVWELTQRLAEAPPDLDALLRQVRDQTGIKPVSRHMLGADILAQMGRGMEAYKEWAAAVRAAPLSPSPPLALAQWFLMQDRPDLAQEVVDAARQRMGSEMPDLDLMRANAADRPTTMAQTPLDAQLDLAALPAGALDGDELEALARSIEALAGAPMTWQEHARWAAARLLVADRCGASWRLTPCGPIEQWAAQVVDALDQRGAARAALSQVAPLLKDASTPAGLVARAALLAASGDWVGADQAVTRATALTTDVLTVLRFNMSSQTRRGDQKAATSSAKELLRMRPGDLEALQVLRIQAANDDDKVELSRLAAVICRVLPASVDALLDRVEVHAAQSTRSVLESSVADLMADAPLIPGEFQILMSAVVASAYQDTDVRGPFGVALDAALAARGHTRAFMAAWVCRCAANYENRTGKREFAFDLACRALNDIPDDGELVDMVVYCHVVRGTRPPAGTLDNLLRNGGMSAQTLNAWLSVSVKAPRQVAEWLHQVRGAKRVQAARLIQSALAGPRELRAQTGVALAQEITSLFTRDVSSRWLLANLQLGNGDRLAAKTTLQTLLKEDPAHLAARRAMLRFNAPPAENVQAAVDLAGDSGGQSDLALAGLLCHANNHAEGARRFAQILSDQDSRHPGAMMLMVNVGLRTVDDDLADSVLAAVELYPEECAALAGFLLFARDVAMLVHDYVPAAWLDLARHRYESICADNIRSPERYELAAMIVRCVDPEQRPLQMLADARSHSGAVPEDRWVHPTQQLIVPVGSDRRLVEGKVEEAFERQKSLERMASAVGTMSHDDSAARQVAAWIVAFIVGLIFTFLRM